MYICMKHCISLPCQMQVSAPCQSCSGVLRVAWAVLLLHSIPGWRLAYAPMRRSSVTSVSPRPCYLNWRCLPALILLCDVSGTVQHHCCWIAVLRGALQWHVWVWLVTFPSAQMTTTHLDSWEPGLIVALRGAMHCTPVLLTYLCCVLRLNCWM